MRRILFCIVLLIGSVVIAPAVSASPARAGVAASAGSAVMSVAAARSAFPTVTSVTGTRRGTGPNIGGNTVVVRGTGFARGATVTFGSAPGRTVKVGSSRMLTVVAPAHVPATVDVRVRTAGGISAVTSADRYTWRPIPADNLAYSQVSTTDVTLRWHNPKTSPGYTRSAVRRAVGPVAPATPTAGVQVGTAGATNVVFTDTGLQPNTTYSYAVFAKAGGVFSIGNPITVRTPATGSVVSQSPPLPQSLPPTGDADIVAYGCSSPERCVAVVDVAWNETVLEFWELTGGTWTELDFDFPPNADTEHPSIGISTLGCVPSGDCVAVGAYDTTTGFSRLRATFSGGTVTATELTYGPDSELRTGGIETLDCRTTTACAGVATFDPRGDTPKAFLVRLDGSELTYTAPARPADLATGTSSRPLLNDISCTSTACTAVGEYTVDDQRSRAVAYTTTATGWTASPLTYGGLGRKALQAIDCVDEICTAVGGRVEYEITGNGPHPDRVLAQVSATLSGGNWTVRPIDVVPQDAGHTRLDAIACRSTVSCVATGALGQSDPGFSRAVAVQLTDGTGQLFRAPIPSTTLNTIGSTLDTVDCRSGGDCIARGEYGDEPGALSTNTDPYTIRFHP